MNQMKGKEYKKIVMNKHISKFHNVYQEMKFRKEFPEKTFYNF
jgi:hypothetical protein